jgi:predicted Rdx family selenoprotein
LASITILPSVENAGRFRVWMNNLNLPREEGEDGNSKMKVPEGVVVKEDGWVLVSDRKIEGGFPEVSTALFFAQILFYVDACAYTCILINDTSYAALGIQLKTLKQRIRSLVQPSRDLGHSDEKGHAAVA